MASSRTATRRTHVETVENEVPVAELPDSERAQAEQQQAEDRETAFFADDGAGGSIKIMVHQNGRPTGPLAYVCRLMCPTSVEDILEELTSRDIAVGRPGELLYLHLVRCDGSRSRKKINEMSYTVIHPQRYDRPAGAVGAPVAASVAGDPLLDELRQMRILLQQPRPAGGGLDFGDLAKMITAGAAAVTALGIGKGPQLGEMIKAVSTANQQGMERMVSLFTLAATTMKEFKDSPNGWIERLVDTAPELLAAARGQPIDQPFDATAAAPTATPDEALLQRLAVAQTVPTAAPPIEPPVEAVAAPIPFTPPDVAEGVPHDSGLEAALDLVKPSEAEEAATP